MKKIIILSMAIILIASYAFAKTKVYKQQTIECVRTNETIVIDGQLDKAWDIAKPANMFVITTTKTPLSPASVRCMYDNENLYVYMKTKDKDIKACETKTDGQTCSDDVLELFLKPGKNCPWYYNVEINALGTAYTGFNHINGGAMPAHAAILWNPNIEYKVFLAGTLNNIMDVDKYWTLEVKIPFSEMPILKGKTPKKGDIWECNFAKYDYSIYLPDGGQELCSTCHTSKVWFHETENYCPLIFK